MQTKIKVHCCYVHVCLVQMTMCGAPNALTRLGAQHFSTVISPSWITEQISVGKCAHRGASSRRERQTSFKIVTWTKQTWTRHHNTKMEFLMQNQNDNHAGATFYCTVLL